MDIYRFLVRALWPLHVLVAVIVGILVMLTGFGVVGDQNLTPRGPIAEVLYPSIIAYGFFLFGMGVAIRSKLHTYVRDEK